ncbi:MAG: SDR family oxidoreductase [Bacteroidota bacterium]
MQKNAVVTGGSKGIGLAIVNKLLEKGFRVFSSSRTIGNLQPLKDIYGDKLIIFNVDLSTKEGVFQLAESIINSIKQVDLLVNNAGVFMPGQIATEEDGSFELQMQLNVAAPYHLTRKLLPLMTQSKDSYIFNMCSTASIVPYLNGGSYCISKHGILGFSKVLREELKPYSVAVSSVLPGATLTDSWSGTELPESRFMKAENIADIIWFAWENRQQMVIEEILLRPMQGDL